MDKETRNFFSGQIIFKCPKCHSPLSGTLHQLGKQIVCKKCGLIIEINKDLIIPDDIDDDLRQLAEEYIREIKDS